MLDKPVDKITREDIEALVANEFREERRLDYKDGLPGGTDKDRREFLADVSSFANGAGGLIIYGVSEKRDDKGQPTGIPGKALGLAGVNMDKVRLQFENSIRDGISPRIPGIRIEVVEGFPEGPVLLLSVPRSWAAPHMVTYKGASRFYSRTSAGKHQLDVGEIRAAFELSAGLSIKLKDFRDERLGRITASDTPVELADSGKLVLHLLPLASFAGSVQVDLHSAHKAVGFYPIGEHAGHKRYNADGLLSYSPYRPPCSRYAQLFRGGQIETVDAEYGSRGMTLLGYERWIHEAVVRFCGFLSGQSVEFPYVLGLGLVHAKGLRMGVHEPRYDVKEHQAIDRDVVVLPETVIDAAPTEETVPSLLKPVLDAIWQAAGWPGCIHYDEHGNWSPRER